MEDISRELEREIARSKPKPYKQDRNARVLIIDDFGEIKSGEYLKILVMILSIISVVCIVLSVLFYYFYTDLSRVAGPNENRLVLAEKKVYDLTRQKEVLMARLVIAGKDPRIEIKKEQEAKPIAQEIEEKHTRVPDNQDIKPAASEALKGDMINESLKVEQGKNKIKPQLLVSTESIEASNEIPPKIIKKMVDIDRKSVV